MAAFCKLLLHISVYGIFGCAAMAVLTTLHQIPVGVLFFGLIPFLVVGQVSAIIAGNWGYLGRVKRFGFRNSFGENKPSLLVIWAEYRRQLKALGFWFYLKCAWLVLTFLCVLSMISGYLKHLPSNDPSLAPMLAAFLSLFFFAHGVMAIQALLDRNLVKEDEEESTAIRPD